MGSSVDIKPSPKGIAVSPAAYLGNNFQAYLAATRAAGLRYNGVCQEGPAKALGQTIAELHAAGFAVVVDPSLRGPLEEQVNAARADDREIDEVVSGIEERMQTAGTALFPFQRIGIRWLLSRRSGALLADSMGLGKSAQALLAAPDNARILVVCPAVVKGNWAAEVRKFRSDLSPVVCGGRSGFRWPEPGEVVVINYDVLPGNPEGQYGDTTLPGFEPPSGVYLILDEAHVCRNWQSRRSRRALAMCNMVRKAGGKTVGLTGTPLVNRPMELWQVLSLFGLQWETFGHWENFVRCFGLEKGKWGGWEHSGVSPEVPGLLRRAMLCRRKEDVLTDLPAKIRQDILVSLPEDVCAQLQAIADRFGVDLGRRMNSKTLAAMLASQEHFEARRAVAEASIPAMLQVVEEYEANDTPLVVFSVHRAPIDLLGKREGWATITGDVTGEARTETIRRFQAGEFRGIACTIGAAGVGITLTHAANELFVDLDWTPAGNLQAEARCHRIGQKSAVMIKRLIADHPLVARVMELLDEKMLLIDETITASAAGADEDRVAARAIGTLDVGAVTGEGLAPAKAPTEDEGAEDVRRMLGLIPAGSYALDGTGANETVFYRLDKPTEGRWAGCTFLKILIGSALRWIGSVTAGGAVRGAIGGVLQRILDAGPLESSMRYGRELGVCGVCGATLTNDESREMGIGPVCRSKFPGA